MYNQYIDFDDYYTIIFYNSSFSSFIPSPSEDPSRHLETLILGTFIISHINMVNFLCTISDLDSQGVQNQKSRLYWCLDDVSVHTCFRLSCIEQSAHEAAACFVRISGFQTARRRTIFFKQIESPSPCFKTDSFTTGDQLDWFPGFRHDK